MGNTSHARGHFTTITRHKLIVMKLCFECGLYTQGLLHDLSKYSPTEFLVGAKYYLGTRSPNAIEREQLGYSTAWMHHKGRNKHHYEYWIDFTSRKIEGPNITSFTSEVGKPNYIIAAPMPTRYVVEMFCDRIAACKVYQDESYTSSSPLEYFEKEIAFVESFMHPDTAAFLLVLLDMLAIKGEAATVHYIREEIVGPRFVYTSSAGF